MKALCGWAACADCLGIYKDDLLLQNLTHANNRDISRDIGMAEKWGTNMPHGSRQLIMLGVDLNKANIQLVKDAVHFLPGVLSESLASGMDRFSSGAGTGMDGIHLLLAHAAMGAEDAMLQLPVCPPADEECRYVHVWGPRRGRQLAKYRITPCDPCANASPLSSASTAWTS